MINIHQAYDGDYIATNQTSHLKQADVTMVTLRKLGRSDGVMFVYLTQEFPAVSHEWRRWEGGGGGADKGITEEQTYHAYYVTSNLLKGTVAEIAAFHA